MADDTNNIIYNKIPRKLLVYLYKQEKSLNKEDLYAAKIKSEIDTTRSHAIRTIQKLEEQQLVKRKQKGRKKITKLTPKGEKIAEKLYQIQQITEDNGE